jgi:hypothetical protein
MFKRIFYLLFIFYFQIQLIYSLLVAKETKSSLSVSFSVSSPQDSLKKIFSLIFLSEIEEENKSGETSDENNENENYEYVIEHHCFNPVNHSLFTNYGLSSADNAFRDCFLKIQFPPPKLLI